VRAAVAAVLLSALVCAPAWSRLEEDQSMVDIREMAAHAKLMFRGRVLSRTIDPSPDPGAPVSYRDGKRMPTALIATFAVDRTYLGAPRTRAAIHFISDFGLAMGHFCIEFQPDQYWLVFAVKGSDGSLELADDCIGALRISPQLGPKLENAAWPEQMEADFIAGIDDPKETMRIFSLQRLGGLGLPSSRPALHAVIDKHNGNEKGWAAYAALETGDMTVMPKVREILDLRGGGVLESDLALALRSIKDPAGVPELVKIASTSRDDLARHEALVGLLYNFHDPRSVPVFGQALYDSDSSIASIGLEGLGHTAKTPACRMPDTLPGADNHAAFARALAECKEWWERDGRHRTLN